MSPEEISISQTQEQENAPPAYQLTPRCIQQIATKASQDLAGPVLRDVSKPKPVRLQRVEPGKLRQSQINGEIVVLGGNVISTYDDIIMLPAEITHDNLCELLVQRMVARNAIPPRRKPAPGQITRGALFASLFVHLRSAPSTQTIRVDKLNYDASRELLKRPDAILGCICTILEKSSAKHVEYMKSIDGEVNQEKVQSMDDSHKNKRKGRKLVQGTETSCVVQ